MTKIWKQAWESEEEYTHALLLNKAAVGTYMDVNSCKSMVGRFPNTRLKILSGHPPTDYFDVGGMFIVSEPLKSVLDEFHVHVEFFLLQIKYQGKKYTKHSFYFCNILDCVDAFDLKQGEYTFWQSSGFTDHIEKIKKLEIDENKALPYHLFRMAKCSPDIVCASDALAMRIVESHFTGMRFIEPEKWTFC